MEKDTQEENRQFRHELKHYISHSDILQLRARLRLLAQPDEHAGPDGKYKIRSLYFDNYADKAVVEKLAGVSRREKFRLRYYGEDTGVIRLEKKSKVKRLTNKRVLQLGRTECEDILCGNFHSLVQNGAPLAAELYGKMQFQQLRPRSIVDYWREAYVYAPGNVRITIDTQIRTSKFTNDFLRPDGVTVPAANAVILEVKFDDYLPDIMRDVIQLGYRQETEFSKYIVASMV